MSDITSLSIIDLAAKIKNQEITAVQAVQAYLDNIEKKEKDIHAFLFINKEGALEEARKIDERIQKGESVGPLAGIPYSVKDIMATKGIPTTGSSRILEGYKPPVDAVVIQRLKEADAILIAKDNCDEFGHGSSTENSGYQITLNPHDTTRVAGGSSGGSAAAVAAEMSAFAIGGDTGGSIRQPAAFCGVTGLKVTYGRVPRSGTFAMASSFDTIGPFGKTPRDTAFILQQIAGQSDHDQTTPPKEVPDYLAEVDNRKDLKKMKIGLPGEYFIDGLDPEIKSNIEQVANKLRELGATVEECSLPHTKYTLPTYYILVPSEVSANMERLDGIRFGPVIDNPQSLTDFYTKNRSKGFGDEVKRRIMVGTYTLSSGYYDAYYQKASKVRTLIKQDFDRAFEKYDALLAPITPSAAFKVGENTNDPLAMYMQDIFTVIANLAGLPALSVPSGTNKEGLPLGAQLIGPQFGESIILQIAHLFSNS